MIRRPPRSTLSSSSAASDVYKRQVSTQSTGCVYFDGKCQYDSCMLISGSADCKANSRCFYTEWANTPCNDYQRLCSELSQEGCSGNPLCVKSGVNCIYTVPEKTGTSPPAECQGFPTWSIALLIVWMFLIGILVFVILIVRKKPQKTDVEQSKVVIEEDAINDNFAPNDLDEPLYN
eukprot:TRINITY_DN13585_c0_g1_i6.p1 TRINITY_DN13585_c0_g1~~TRINITY_DN13585_c0_g1_i6.p1  ORF type:complete len:177 (+),score=39.64 TRINITY_DN13585_c0_g1_i6:139-669(+)